MRNLGRACTVGGSNSQTNLVASDVVLTGFDQVEPVTRRLVAHVTVHSQVDLLPARHGWGRGDEHEVYTARDGANLVVVRARLLGLSGRKQVRVPLVGDESHEQEPAGVDAVVVRLAGCDLLARRAHDLEGEAGGGEREKQGVREKGGYGQR